MVVSTALTTGFPTGFPLVGRIFGGCSCRILLFLGWPDSLQQPVHHWQPRNSNPRAVQIRSCFQALVEFKGRKYSAFWNSDAENNPKNNRSLFIAGPWGSNAFPFRPPRAAESVSHTASMVALSADRRNARVGRSLAPHPHPRNPKPTSRPA